MSKGCSAQHRTLFAMRREDIPPALELLRPLLSELLSLLRPLRLGWLKHRDIGIARGIDLISDLDIAAATRKRKGRLAIDPQLYEAHIFVPEFLEEIYDFPNGTFALFRRQRRIGVGFKATRADGDVCLSWVKLSDLMPRLAAEGDEHTANSRYSIGTLSGLSLSPTLIKFSARYHFTDLSLLPVFQFMTRLWPGVPPRQSS
jgi:hypothetical protein